MINYEELGRPETRSLWLSTYGDYDPQPKLKGTISTDVAIIGGGFGGLSTAWHLKQRAPGISSCVLEGAVTGFGASGRNGGFSMTMLGLEPGLTSMFFGEERTKEAHHYMDRVVKYVKNLTQEHGFDSEYEHNGIMRLAVSDTGMKKVAEMYESYQKLGVEGFRWIDRSEISSEVRSPLFQGGFEEKNAAILNPAKQVREWLRMVLRSGVSVYENTPVLKLDLSGKKIRVSTPEGTVNADKLVFCTNGYSHLFDDVQQLRRKQTPVWSHVIATEPLSEELWTTIGWNKRQAIDTHRNNVHYLRPTADKRLVIGGSDAGIAWGRKMNNDNNPLVWAKLERHMRCLFPSLSHTKIEYRWGGPVSVSMDFIPRLGTLKDDRLLMGAAYCGHGVALSQYSGQIFSDLILGEKTEASDVWFVDKDGWSMPPELFRWLGMHTIGLAMKLDDWRAERGIWHSA